MKEKEPRISVRVTSDIKIALERVEKTTGIAEAELVRACVKALIEYVDEHGELTVPLAIKPKRKDYARGDQHVFLEDRPLKKKPAA